MDLNAELKGVGSVQWWEKMAEDVGMKNEEVLGRRIKRPWEREKLYEAEFGQSGWAHPCLPAGRHKTTAANPRCYLLILGMVSQVLQQRRSQELL